MYRKIDRKNCFTGDHIRVLRKKRIQTRIFSYVNQDQVKYYAQSNEKQKLVEKHGLDLNRAVLI